MSSTSLHPDILLSRWQKTASCVVGAFLVVGAMILYLFPPTRLSSKVKDGYAGYSEINHSESADPTSLVIALASAGSVLFVYGLNGIRIIRVSMSSLNLETLTAPLSNASPQIPAPGSSPTSQQSQDIGSKNDLIELYARRSSWIGLKVLKACVLANKRQMPFSLRASPVVGPQSSFDYCYGYLIASFALGVIVGSSDPGVDLVFIENIDTKVKENIDTYINDNIKYNPALADYKRRDMKSLEDYFENLK